jgi:hypothetical protein
MPKTDPTSWVNVLLSSSPAARDIANKAVDIPTTAAALPGLAALRTACRSLDFPMIPAGRSVKALPLRFPWTQFWTYTLLRLLERAISLARKD